MKDLLDFTGKTILVTGASRGIGLAAAQQLLEAGASLLCLSRSLGNLKMLQEKYPQQLNYYPVDLAQEREIDAFCQKLPQQLDGLLYNAGYFKPALLCHTELNDFKTHLQVNVSAAFQLVKSCWPLLKQAQGTIVFISSLAGVCQVEKFATAGAYTASKMALTGLCEVIAVEGKEFGIRANVLAPGAVDTQMLRSVYPTMKADFIPEDIARQILFWLSPASAPVSGSVVMLRV